MERVKPPSLKAKRRVISLSLARNDGGSCRCNRSGARATERKTGSSSTRKSPSIAHRARITPTRARIIRVESFNILYLPYILRSPIGGTHGRLRARTRTTALPLLYDKVALLCHSFPLGLSGAGPVQLARRCCKRIIRARAREEGPPRHSPLGEASSYRFASFASMI